MITVISEWIRNIIVFIIFATILDMLLPSSSLGKYVNFVISLLLFVLLVTPLFEIFKMPIQEALEDMVFSNESMENKQNQLEEKKVEIQARQHAYILEQMAVQLKKQINPKLKEKFQVEMISGTFDAAVSEQNVLEEIHQVQVVIQNSEGQMIRDIPAVESVQIGKTVREGVGNEDKQDEKIQVIRDFLAQELGIDSEKVEIIRKGEES